MSNLFCRFSILRELAEILERIWQEQSEDQEVFECAEEEEDESIEGEKYMSVKSFL